MNKLLKIMNPELDATIQRLSEKEFEPDPIAGKRYSKIVSVMSSAYKRHGFIIEKAILEQLRLNPKFEVWEDKKFQVHPTADHIVDSSIGNPEHILKTETSYRQGERTLQVDAIVYNKKTRSLRAYEIKRGSGLHDAGKRRSMLRDILCLQVLLKSYGEKRGFSVKNARAYIIFYYGECSIDKPFSLTGDELDEHFGFPIVKSVEKVNDSFKRRLHSMLS